MQRPVVFRLADLRYANVIQWLFPNKTATAGIIPVLIVGLLSPIDHGLAEEPPITAVAFTPDGDSVVALSQSGIHVYDWPKLTKSRTFEASMPNLHALAFSPDGKRLAVGGGYPAEEGVVEIFTWPAGDAIGNFDDHDDSVRSLVWIDNQRLISASIDRSIRQFDTQEMHRTQVFSGHSRSVDCIAILRDGNTLVSTGADGTLRVWDLESAQMVRSLNQHTRPVNALALRPATDGLPIVATAADDRTIRFWQPTIGRMMRYARLTSAASSIAWTNDGSRLLAACVDGHVRIIDPVNVTVIDDIPVLQSWAYALAVHPNDGNIVIAGADGQIRRVELQGTQESAQGR